VHFFVIESNSAFLIRPWTIFLLKKSFDEIGRKSYAAHIITNAIAVSIAASAVSSHTVAPGHILVIITVTEEPTTIAVKKIAK
jgi:hypothetical protein